MLDIHNHLLKNVDDGPKSMEEILILLKQAKNEGVTGIIVTPHHLHPNWNNTYPRIEIMVDKLLLDSRITEVGVKLFPGQEVRIKDQILRDLDNGDIKGLNASRYILIELPSGQVPSATKQILYELQVKGLVPIIAHPERNKVIANDLEILYELVNNGALSQLTSTSLNGNLGKKVQKISIQMIENNLIHFIASDAHHATTRPFLMNTLLKNKKLNHIIADIEQIFSNGTRVVTNKKILKLPPTKPKKKRKFLGLF